MLLYSLKSLLRTLLKRLKRVIEHPLLKDNILRSLFYRAKFYKADISDSKALKEIFRDHKDIEAIIHCAALVIVPESVQKPYLYYQENVSKSLELFKFASDSKIICIELNVPSLAAIRRPSLPDFRLLFTTS